MKLKYCSCFLILNTWKNSKAYKVPFIINKSRSSPLFEDEQKSHSYNQKINVNFLKFMKLLHDANDISKKSKDQWHSFHASNRKSIIQFNHIQNVFSDVDTRFHCKMSRRIEISYFSESQKGSPHPITQNPAYNRTTETVYLFHRIFWMMNTTNLDLILIMKTQVTA